MLELDTFSSITALYLNISESNGNLKDSAASSVRKINITGSTRREIYHQYLNALAPCFERFKKTIAYQALYQKVLEFEDISERVYD